MADATVSFDLADALGNNYNWRGTKLWVVFNTATGRVTDSDGKIRLGAGVATVNPDGTGTIEGIPIPSGTSNPTTFQVMIKYSVEPRLPSLRSKDRETGDFGWMTITADVDLAVLEAAQYAPPEYQGAFVAELQGIADEAGGHAADAEGFRDETQALRDGIVGDLGTTDSQVATLATPGSGSLLEGVLSDTFVEEGSAFADLGKQAGVDNTGTTECAAAIQTALDGMLALGVRAYAKGTFNIASMVTVEGNADLDDATFQWVGTGGGIAVQGGPGGSGVVLSRARIALPRVINTKKTTTGWAQSGVAGTTGVKLVNLDACTVIVPHVQGFETGLHLYGEGEGTVHTTVHLGHLDTNKVQHLASADATGWCNSNLTIGGKMSYNSAEGASVAGTRNIHIPVTTNLVNSNKWLDVSLEGDTPEYHVECGGINNEWANCRWENGVTGCRVKSNSPATKNFIRGGYRAEYIVQTLGAGAVPMNIYSTVREDFAEQAAGGTASTHYSIRKDHLGIHIKPVVGTVDRLFLETSSGKIFFGDGTNLNAYLQAIGSAGLALGGANLYFATDNTKDIGLDASTLRPRDIFLGRNLNIGGALTHRGTTAGFYNTTPVVRPAAYIQTYSTASRTHAALTSADAVAAPTKAEFDALRADLINTRQVLNQVLDDLQLNGLLQ